ncbi:tRNA (adenosine(37)-N6)-threonylcarbamoyltransferase complex transferase subunit TsaD [Corynebacterium urogenitale]
MHVLTVDTSTAYVVAGIVEIPESDPRALNTVSERIVDNPRGHMELLTPNIVECLAEAGLEPEELSAVVVGTGPGPFTGLRVGMATAQAFGDALSIPVHGVESLAAIAATSELPEVLVLTDARRREWYGGHYRKDGDTLFAVEGPFVDKPDVIMARQGVETPIIVAKSLADHEALAGSDIADRDALPTPQGLVRAALLTNGGFTAASARALLTPGEPLRALYLRRPDAVEPKAKPVSSALDFGAMAEDGDQGGVEQKEELRTVRLDQSAAAEMEEIERDLFAEDSPWSPEGIRAELSAVNTHYIGIRRDGQLLGYLGLAKNGPSDDPEWEIHTVAVRREAQGMGLSHRLMVEALRKVDGIGGQVFLEVRTDNAPAVGLYERYGFRAVGVRKNYYQPSGADAYVMVRPCFGGEGEAVAAEIQRDATPPASAEGDRDTRGMIILGVESSCDETGVGIVELTQDNAAGQEADGPCRVRMISNRVASSMTQHARFGGVVPEIASRAHLEAMVPTMRQALRDLRADRAARGLPTSAFDKPDAVAATVGPGLAGALLVGAAAAKAYAAAWKVPFYGVNHLGGHVAVDLLVTEDSEGREEHAAPGDLDNAIALLVSGGHTQILHVRGVGKPMEEMGGTLDDAAGEAYDKVARLLGLGYPGGPIIDKLAAKGNAKAISFPRAMMRQQDARYDFSFSGLKTAVARYVETAEREGRTIPIEDVCASFQEAVCDVLTAKAVRAAKDVGATTMLLGGGVSANSRLRGLLLQRCKSAGIYLHIPPFALCTDNGVMIAALAAQVIAAGAQPSGLDVDTDPSLEVEIPVVAGRE